MNTPPPGLTFDDVVARLRRIVFDCAGEAAQGTPEDIPLDEPFVNGNGPVVLDSVDAVEIAVLVKQAFGVEFKNASSASKVMRDIRTLANHILETRARTDAQLSAQSDAQATTP